MFTVDAIQGFHKINETFRGRFKEAIPMEKPKGWNLPLGNIKRENHGGGFLLLGDAAGLVDPFTGEGIGNAMVSGRIASEVAAKAKQKNIFTKGRKCKLRK